MPPQRIAEQLGIGSGVIFWTILTCLNRCQAFRPVQDKGLPSKKNP